MNIEKEYVEGLLRKIERLQAERDSAMQEASYLAMSIWRSEFQKVSPDFELCDSPAGVISQIDNMYAAIRGQRDALAALVNDACAMLNRVAQSEEAVIDSDLNLIIDSGLMYDIEDFVENKTPQQCLRDVKAEAGRAGYLTCLYTAEDYFDSYYAGILTEADAEEYAAKVRQGGAE